MRDRYPGQDDEILDGQSVRVPLALCDAKQRAVAARYATVDADAHRPHYLQPTAEQLRDRREVRARFVADLSNAWRGAGDKLDADNGGPTSGGPGPIVEPEPDKPPKALKPPEPMVDPVELAAENAYRIYKRALSQAWRLSPDPTPFAAPPADLIEAGRAARLLALAPPVGKSSAPLIDPRSVSEIAKILTRMALGEVVGADDASKVRTAAYNEYVANLGDAWRTPQLDRKKPDDDDEDDPHASDPDAAAALAERLERSRSPDLIKLARDLETKRAAQRTTFNTQLENAWRT